MSTEHTEYSKNQDVFPYRNAPNLTRNHPIERTQIPPPSDPPRGVTTDGSRQIDEIKPTRFPFSSLEIILAEDHTANLAYSIKLLNNLGYHPRAARNGLEVIEMVQVAPCDLILMDCYMPEVDGREAARTIRHLESKNLLPNKRPIQIIGVTANDNLSEKRACMDSGMDSFISKPLLRNPLNERLMNFWIELNLNTLDQTMPEELINEFKEVVSTLENLRREIGGEATNELIHDFIQSTPERLNEMQHALDTHSIADLRRIAHSYKSVCQIYGLGLMSSLCAKLELKALSNDTQEAKLLIRQIQQLFQSVLPVIKSSASTSE